MRKLILSLRSQRGAAMVEYGILVALIAVVCIGAILLLGGQINTFFTTVTGTLAPFVAPAT